MSDEIYKCLHRKTTATPDSWQATVSCRNSPSRHDCLLHSALVKSAIKSFKCHEAVTDLGTVDPIRAEEKRKPELSCYVEHHVDAVCRQQLRLLLLDQFVDENKTLSVGVGMLKHAVSLPRLFSHSVIMLFWKVTASLDRRCCFASFL